MKTYTTEELQAILDKHRKWQRGEKGGKRANLEGSDLWGVNLKGADLRGLILCGSSIRNAHLEGADLEGADLEGADLRDANFEGANLKNTNLKGAYLKGANLKGVNLRDANLLDANLLGVDLSGANLRSADLRYTDLRYSDLNDANLLGAHFRDAYLKGTKLGDVRWHARPLQILGSRDALIVLRPSEIRVGCIALSPDEWLAWYKDIGHDHGYSSAEIHEYGEHLRYAVRWLEMAKRRGWYGAVEPAPGGGDK